MNSVSFTLFAMTDLEDAQRQALVHVKQFLGDVRPAEVNFSAEPTETAGQFGLFRSVLTGKWDVDVVARW